MLLRINSYHHKLPSQDNPISLKWIFNLRICKEDLYNNISLEMTWSIQIQSRIKNNKAQVRINITRDEVERSFDTESSSLHERLKWLYLRLQN